jgi:transposase-like protein
MGFIRFGDENTCPRCGSNLVRRSRRRGMFERIMCALGLISPFRCEDCDYRYFRFRSSQAHQAHRPA